MGVLALRRVGGPGSPAGGHGRRLPELAETFSALSAGEVSEDQAAVVCRHAPTYADAEVATLARHTTVSQLSRTLRPYSWAADPEDDKEKAPEEAEPRRVDFGTTEEGSWRLSALLPPDQGALVERALDVARGAWSMMAWRRLPGRLVPGHGRSLPRCRRRHPAPPRPARGGGAPAWR